MRSQPHTQMTQQDFRASVKNVRNVFFFRQPNGPKTSDSNEWKLLILAILLKVLSELAAQHLSEVYLRKHKCLGDLLVICYGATKKLCVGWGRVGKNKCCSAITITIGCGTNLSVLSQLVCAFLPLKEMVVRSNDVVKPRENEMSVRTEKKLKLHIVFAIHTKRANVYASHLPSCFPIMFESEERKNRLYNKQLDFSALCKRFGLYTCYVILFNVQQ